MIWQFCRLLEYMAELADHDNKARKADDDNDDDDGKEEDEPEE